MLSNPEDNREIAKGNLSPLTDWNWSGNIQIPANENGKKLNLTVTSSFNDGKEATATSQFLYQKDFKSTAITGKDWNTLLQNASHSGGINDSQIKLPCNYNGQRTQEVTSSWPPPHRRTKSIHCHYR